MGHSYRRSLLALVSLIAVAAASLLLSAAAEASFPGAVGLLAFQSNRDGNTEIYTQLPGFGNTVNRLTNNSAVDAHPKWSPDGKKIAFESNRDGNLEIYVMNADGSGQTRITNNAAFDEFPSWSPDGTKMVFDSGRDDPHGEIYTMNADGTGVTRLTNDPGYDFGSNWSPDNTKITWQSSRNANQYDVFTMNVDGTSQTDLTNSTSVQDVQPNWSPDGLRIDYASNPSGQYDIYMMNANGSGQTQWTPTTAVDEQSPGFQPSWLNGSGGILMTRYNASHTASDIYRYATIRYTNGTDIGALDEFGDWQAVNETYARPKGATPLRVPLVPAYKRCDILNATAIHRGAISGDACYVPKAESTHLTVGSPEFNGVGANMIGSVLFRAKATVPEDGLISVSLTDVRCQGTGTGCSGGALSDYSGSLLFETNFRVTDRNNGPTGIGPSANATVTDMPATFPVGCTPTAPTTVGSTCSVATSLDAVFGGATAVDDGKRAIWELLGFADGRGILKLWDGGADGNGLTTGDNTLYAVGGLFFP